MYNLIKMELYRLCHATSTWVILITMVAITAGLMALTGLIVETDSETSDGIMSLEAEAANEDYDTSENDLTIGIYVSEEDGWNSKEAEFATILASMLQSSVLVILCVIFAATYVHADQKNGYLKNIAGQYPFREKLVFAKCAALAVADLVFLAAFVATAAIAAKIIWGSGLYLDSCGALLKVAGVHYLLLMGFSLAILMITVLTRSSTAGVLIGILVSSNMLSMFCTLINMLVKKALPNTGFDSTLYTIGYYLGSYGVGAAASDTVRAVALALLYGALAALAAAWVMKKRDVL